MRVDVFFEAREVGPGDVAGRVVGVVDVLRASTSIATAIANGARAVVPFESTDEVSVRAKTFERAEVRLAGERRMRAIDGFDFGNSPLEFTRSAVAGKTVLMTTTNGTAAIAATQAAQEVYVGGYVNMSRTVEALRAALRSGTDLSIVCAGHEGHFALEDAACAGRLTKEITRRLTNVELNDAAFAAMQIDRRFGDDLNKLFEASVHGRALAAAGFEADLAACAAIDAHPVLLVYQDRQITRLASQGGP
jgi:2-phosphosulfolactate phosphatase